MRKNALTWPLIALFAAALACGPSRAQIESEIYSTLTADASSLSGTSTAIAEGIFADLTAEAELAAAETTCVEFDAEEIEAVLVSIAGGGEESILYFHMPGGVPGMEPGDADEETYTAQVGDAQSSFCGVYEGYEERLYCAIDLPGGYLDTRQDISLSALGCQEAVFSALQVSIQAAGIAGPSGGGGGGGEGGGNGGSGGGLPGGLSCGPAPDNTGVCGNSPPPAFENWCACTGGTISEEGEIEGTSYCSYSCN